jgi:hypothetical protein
MSSGGGGQQTSTTTQSVPPWLQDAAQGYLGSASQVAQLPYTPYTGQRVANLSPLQQQSIQNIGDLAGGTGSMGAAEGMLQNTLNGGYSNPFTQGVSSGGQYGFNPVQAGSNPYSGLDNPYFRQNQQGALDDVVHAYQTATSPDIARMFTMSGTFGGSAHQQAQSNAERELAQQLGRVASGMSGQQYDRSAQLAESGLGRDLSAQTFNANLGNSAFENAAQRGLNAGQFNANLGSQSYENERNRQMGAVGAATNLYSNLLQGQNTALNAGNTERNQQQSLLDSQYGDFQDWRNYPAQQLGIFGNALGAVTGAAPRTTTSSADLPPPDRVGQGLGVMALANAFGRGSSK